MDDLYQLEENCRCDPGDDYIICNFSCKNEINKDRPNCSCKKKMNNSIEISDEYCYGDLLIRYNKYNKYWGKLVHYNAEKNCFLHFGDMFYCSITKSEPQNVKVRCAVSDERMRRLNFTVRKDAFEALCEKRKKDEYSDRNLSITTSAMRTTRSNRNMKTTRAITTLAPSYRSRSTLLPNSAASLLEKKTKHVYSNSPDVGIDNINAIILLITFILLLSILLTSDNIKWCKRTCKRIMNFFNGKRNIGSSSFSRLRTVGYEDRDEMASNISVQYPEDKDVECKEVV